MSEHIRVEAEFHLRRIQQGEALSLPLSRPMPAIGANCHELCLKDAERNIEWRIVCCIDCEMTLVLEVFGKKGIDILNLRDLNWTRVQPGTDCSGLYCLSGKCIGNAVYHSPYSTMR